MAMNIFYGQRIRSMAKEHVLWPSNMFYGHRTCSVGKEHVLRPLPQKRCRGLMVSFVLALNRINVVAVTIKLVLHIGVIGRHVPCHYELMFPRRS